MAREVGQDLVVGRLRQARLIAGLTQEALARRVFCSVGMISKIECGRCKPSRWLLESIARETGCPLRFFLDPYPSELTA